MKNLIVSDITVRLVDGLYSLNDLHKAAGGEAKHQPSNFMRLDTTLALAAEISNENSQSSDVRSAYKVVTGGTNPGTYVCKELVYAYAMWISPAFNLRVIRAFDSMSQEELPLEKLKPLAEGYTALVGALKAVGLDNNAAAIGANNAIRRLVSMDLLALTGNTHFLAETQEQVFTPTELGQMFESTVFAIEMNKRLAVAGLQYKEGKKWIITEKGKPFVRFFDVGKRYSDGTPVLQPKWLKSVLDELPTDEN